MRVRVKVRVRGKGKRKRERKKKTPAQWRVGVDFIEKQLLQKFGNFVAKPFQQFASFIRQRI